MSRWDFGESFMVETWNGGEWGMGDLASEKFYPTLHLYHY